MQMTDQVKKLRLDGPAGTGPDVVTLPHDQIGNAVTEGLLSEVKADDAVKSKFTDSSIEAQTYNGKLYGLPKAIETPVFIYNKKTNAKKRQKRWTSCLTSQKNLRKMASTDF